jgi:LPXTG-motif cell wall-anchored protein
MPTVAVASPSSSKLPRTGSEPFRMALIGAGLLGTGASLVLWRRGQRPSSAA